MKEAKISPVSKVNVFVWFFPAIALAICGWLLYSYLKQQGPTLHIFFEDGSSIQAEKTRVRFRGVSVGVVKSVSITEDAKLVDAEVQLDRDAADFAVNGSKFWIVMPEVNFQGVSGLETIFEGTYIAVQPGPRDGEAKKEFKGLRNSDNTENLEDTVAYDLETANADAIRTGDNVTFRGVSIGSITKIDLSKTAQKLEVRIRVQNKYIRLIRTNSIFWRKVAIQAKLGLFNSEVKINSLESLLRGGIEVFTPDPPGPLAKAGSHFTLNPAPPKGWEKWNPALEK